MKTCTKCGEPKELTEFYLNSKCRDGYDTRCKECVSEIKKEYWIRNKEVLSTKKKEYWQTVKLRAISDSFTRLQETIKHAFYPTNQ